MAGIMSDQCDLTIIDSEMSHFYGIHSHSSQFL